MLIAYFMNEFDKAYIFISSMTSRQKIDMCACFLKLGYGISEDNTTSIQVVNLSDDNKFFANLSFLFKKFKINCYIRICKEKNGYSKAWLHHFGRNKHHFEYWYDTAAPVKKPIIPFKYMLEMICDRVAASKTYRKKKYTPAYPLEYFYIEEPSMVLNDHLKDFLEEVFIELKDKGEVVLNKKYLKELYLKHIKDETYY